MNAVRASYPHGILIRPALPAHTNLTDAVPEYTAELEARRAGLAPNEE